MEFAPIDMIANWLGVKPATFVFMLFAINVGSNVVTRLIPDTATGWLGNVRKVTQVIGTYVASRIAPGITTVHAAKAVVAQAETWVQENRPQQSQEPPKDSLVQEVMDAGLETSEPEWVDPIAAYQAAIADMPVEPAEEDK